MESIIKYFLSLGAQEQVRFLREGDFAGYAALSKENKTEFIKQVLKCDLSSKATATAIKSLRELGYKDKFFYRKFLYHLDSSVANAAKKAISDSAVKKDTGVIRIVKDIQDSDETDKIKKIKSLLKEKKELNEEIIINLLKMEEQNIREIVVQGITSEQELDDRKLAEAVQGGAVWYARAALVAILGKRKSSSLLDIIDSLIEDKNVEVRLELIKALSNFGGDEARPYLKKLTADPLIWVRKRAHDALALVDKNSGSSTPTDFKPLFSD